MKKSEQTQRPSAGPRSGARRAAGAALGASLLLLLASCGRPATEDECREILRRTAELELRSRVGDNEALIEAEVRALEESMRPAMMKQCVGKRVTEGALACVRSAKSAAELSEECFR